MRVIIDDITRSFEMANRYYVFHRMFLDFKKGLELMLSKEQIDDFYSDDTKRIFNVPIEKIREFEKQFDNYKSY